MAIEYTRTTWINDQEPPINAQNLNNIELAIVNLVENANYLLEEDGINRSGVKISNIDELNNLKSDVYIYGSSGILDELNGSWIGTNLITQSIIAQIFLLRKSNENTLYLRICNTPSDTDTADNWNIVELPNYNKMFYLDGEEVSLSGSYCLGLITSSGTSMRFDVNLQKSIANIKSVDVVLDSVTARSYGHYVWQGDLPALIKYETHLRQSNNSITIDINRYKDADFLDTRPWVYKYDQEKPYDEENFSSIMTIGQLDSSGKTFKFEIPVMIDADKIADVSSVEATLSNISATADGGTSIYSGGIPNTATVNVSRHQTTGSMLFTVQNTTEWKKDGEDITKNKLCLMSVSGKYKINYKKEAYYNNEVLVFVVNGKLTMHTK